MANGLARIVRSLAGARRQQIETYSVETGEKDVQQVEKRLVKALRVTSLKNAFHMCNS